MSNGPDNLLNCCCQITDGKVTGDRIDTDITQAQIQSFDAFNTMRHENAVRLCTTNVVDIRNVIEQRVDRTVICTIR